MPHLTKNQLEAIKASGDVLVLAGAGTGKTHALVEYCLARLFDPRNPASLDEILMVTFTEAAAGEMRSRIRARLELAAAQDRTNPRLLEELALVETARICTLHSFCLELVREHFHELGLDPQLFVLPEERSRLLATQTLEHLLEKYYSEQTPEGEEVRQLAFYYGGHTDEAVRDIVLRVYDYIQTLPEPDAWLKRQTELLDQDEPRHWVQWYLEAVKEWRQEWIERLDELAADNPNAKQCAELLRRTPDELTMADVMRFLPGVLAIDDAWPKRKKTVLRKPIEDIFKEAEFLASLLPSQTSTDPLRDDWVLIRPYLKTLFRLTAEFSNAFAAAKREIGALDFHDLEQMSLRLLWNPSCNNPTEIAQQWRAKLKYILVDEFQDINAVQEKIIAALAREGPGANRFLVGDLKQSIYRFRLADPRICRRYAERFRANNGAGRLVHLTENFRSKRGILDFANTVFELLMRPEVGGVSYDENAKLKCSRITIESVDASCKSREACVELLLRLTGDDDSTNESSEDALILEGGDAEKEALLVAQRLNELRREKFPVWDSEKGVFRPVEWRDMAVLLRAPKNRAEAYASAFDRVGVPLVTSRSGLYDAIEVSDLLQLLRVLDNPLQDIPLIAVLRSPLVGMTLDELAVIRLVDRTRPYWDVLRRFHAIGRESSFSSGDRASAKTGALEVGVGRPDANSSHENDHAQLLHRIRHSAWKRADNFLNNYSRWRRIARRYSVSACLECVLEETRYEDLLAACHPSGQAVANVRRFLTLAREFDRSEGRGLFQFLQQIETEKEMEFDPEPAVVGGENVVRLMSVHQSKGLEFPVVVIGDLGRQFNLRDLSRNVVLDEELGICPKIRAGGKGQFYPSLPHWISARRQKREVLGEELRLLYVAVTRAADMLILCGSAPKKVVSEQWQCPSTTESATHTMLKARSWLDWLGPLLPRLCDDAAWFEKPRGSSALVKWWVVRDSKDGLCRRDGDSRAAPADVARLGRCNATSGDLEELNKICAEIARLSRWSYPHVGATFEPAKVSVSILRRRAVGETDTEARPIFAVGTDADLGFPHDGRSEISGAERGTAHHRFLQLAEPGNLVTLEGARKETNKLELGGFISHEEARALDLESIAKFWASSVGQQLLANRQNLFRELEFTVRFCADDLRELGIDVHDGISTEEFFMVQGIVDVAVIRESDIWILDFKTDQITDSELESKARVYRPQLFAYAKALSRIYSRPVTRLWLHFLQLDRTVPLMND